MTTIEKVERLKNAAGFISMFKGSTEGIDEVLSDLLGEDYHTEKQYDVPIDKVAVGISNLEIEADQ